MRLPDADSVGSFGESANTDGGGSGGDGSEVVVVTVASLISHIAGSARDEHQVSYSSGAVNLDRFVLETMVGVREQELNRQRILSEGGATDRMERDATDDDGLHAADPRARRGSVVGANESSEIEFLAGALVEVGGSNDKFDHREARHDGHGKGKDKDNEARKVAVEYLAGKDWDWFVEDMNRRFETAEDVIVPTAKQEAQLHGWQIERGGLAKPPGPPSIEQEKAAQAELAATIETLDDSALLPQHLPVMPTDMLQYRAGVMVAMHSHVLDLSSPFFSEGDHAFEKLADIHPVHGHQHYHAHHHHRGDEKVKAGAGAVAGGGAGAEGEARASLFRKGRFLYVSVVAPTEGPNGSSIPNAGGDAGGAAAVAASRPASPSRAEGAKMLVCGQWEQIGAMMFPRTHNCVMDATFSDHLHSLRQGVEHEIKAALKHERGGFEYEEIFFCGFGTLGGTPPPPPYQLTALPTHRPHRPAAPPSYHPATTSPPPHITPRHRRLRGGVAVRRHAHPAGPQEA